MAKRFSLKFGNREKIVVGFIAMLVFIAVTHWVLYRPKSVELSKINEEYNAALAQYQEFASKNLPTQELNKLNDRVTELDTLLTNSIKEFEIGKPVQIVGGGKAFMRILDELEELEKTTNKPKINILAGWTISDEIPGLEPARIPDYLDQLRQKKAILLMPNIPEDLKLNFDYQYRELLQRLGYNKLELEKLNAFIAWLKQIKMFYYILDHKGATDIKDAELLTILNIPIYEPEILNIGMFFLLRTRDLIDLGIKSQLETISDVKLIGSKDVRPKIKETPTPTKQPGSMMGEEYMSEFGGRMPPGMGGPEGRFFPGLFGGFRATPTPTPPPEKAAARSIPIEMVITGDNISIMKFLYGVTHSPILMDIRSLDITTLDEGKLSAKVTVNCYRDVKAVEDYLKVAKDTKPTPKK